MWKLVSKYFVFFVFVLTLLLAACSTDLSLSSTNSQPTSLESTNTVSAKRATTSEPFDPASSEFSVTPSGSELVEIAPLDPEVERVQRTDAVIRLEELDNGHPKFIQFTDKNCLSCLEMNTIIKELEIEYSEEILFYSLEMDSIAIDSARLMDALGFRYPPHFFLIDGDGAIVGEWQGITKIQEFHSAFAEVLSDKEQ